MFDGVLSRYEFPPDSDARPTPDRWPWQLTALLLAMTGLLILAATVFPDVLGDPGPRF